MVNKARFEDAKLIDRCRRFWNREPVQQPLVGILLDRIHPLRDFQTDSDKQEVVPSDVAVEDFVAECERRHQASENTEGDAVFVAYPTIGLPWLEGILGCQVQFNGSAAWTKPYQGDWKTYDLDSVPWDNGWLDKMKELTRTAIEAGKGRYPVGPCHLRGFIDAAASMIGSEQLCLAIYESPENLGRFLDVVTDVWIKVTKAQYEILPSYFGGYFNANQPLWAPGMTMFVPADAVSLLSPSVVQDWVIPRVQRMVQGLDYSIAHTHSTYLHALDPFLEIEQLRAVQVGMDTAGPSIEELLPTFRKIMGQKSLIISIVLEDPIAAARDAQLAIRALPSSGLCILSYLPNAEAGREFMSRVGQNS